MQLYVRNKNVIDTKYNYFFNYDRRMYDGANSLASYDKINLMRAYYNRTSQSRDFESGWFDAGDKLEILKYDLADSIAFIKTYNYTSKRMVRENYSVISMKCLHDTLPNDLKAQLYIDSAQ